MQRRELARFHNIASSTKSRGEGIGFAGVGIKLGLLVCEEVFTETRRGKTHIASSWHLATRNRAPWKWVAPLKLIAERGTAVRLQVENPLSPLLDPGFLAVTLRRHFQPLLDPSFDEFLRGHYPRWHRHRGRRPPAGQTALERAAHGAFGNSPHAQTQSLRFGLPDSRRSSLYPRSARVCRSAPLAKSSGAAGTGWV